MEHNAPTQNITSLMVVTLLNLEKPHLTYGANLSKSGAKFGVSTFSL